MNEKIGELYLPEDWQTATPIVIKTFERRGLRVMQSFDFNVSKTSIEGICPNHGTEACDCEYVVLLVYGNQQEPMTLIGHGSNKSIRFEVNQTSRQKLSPELINDMKEALFEAQMKLADPKVLNS